jgi:hypothetical protein
MMVVQELSAWLPWWAVAVVAVPVAVYLVAFFLVPFSVFGVKGRLDLIEARLEELQSELRAFGLRAPEISEIPLTREADRPLVAPNDAEQLLARGTGDRRWTQCSEPRLDWRRGDSN